MATTRKTLDDLGVGVWTSPDDRATFIEFDSPAQMAKLTARSESYSDRGWYYGTAFRGPNQHDRHVEALTTGNAPDALFDLYCQMRDKLQPAVDRFAGLGITTKRRRVRREEGAELDIDRMMTGDPACWETRIRGRKKKLVRLAVQTVYVAGAGEEIFARGAALAAAAADVLQRIGYAVEIVGVFCGVHYSEPRRSYVITTNLKQADEPLDPRNLLVIGLPSMARVFGFSALDAVKSSGAEGLSMPRWNTVANAFASSWDTRAQANTEPFHPSVRDRLAYTAFVGQTFEFNGSVNYSEIGDGLDGLFAEFSTLV